MGTEKPCMGTEKPCGVHVCGTGLEGSAIWAHVYAGRHLPPLNAPLANSTRLSSRSISPLFQPRLSPPLSGSIALHQRDSLCRHTHFNLPSMIPIHACAKNRAAYFPKASGPRLSNDLHAAPEVLLDAMGIPCDGSITITYSSRVPPKVADGWPTPCTLLRAASPICCTEGSQQKGEGAEGVGGDHDGGDDGVFQVLVPRALGRLIRTAWRRIICSAWGGAVCTACRGLGRMKDETDRPGSRSKRSADSPDGLRALAEGHAFPAAERFEGGIRVWRRCGVSSGLRRGANDAHQSQDDAHDMEEVPGGGSGRLLAAVGLEVAWRKPRGQQLHVPSEKAGEIRRPSRRMQRLLLQTQLVEVWSQGIHPRGGVGRPIILYLGHSITLTD